MLEILSTLDGADVWIGGGWGIDALVGKQKRAHQDLDLMHRQELEPFVVEALARAGFAETLSWRRTSRTAIRRRASSPTILGTLVPCLSAEQQVYFHQGYEPRERDLHDMTQLRAAFGVRAHFPNS